MIPINILKKITSIGGISAPSLKSLIEKQCNESDLIEDIRKCSLDSLEESIREVLNVVPQSMHQHLGELVSFYVRRDPLSHELKACLLFSPEGILNALTSHGNVDGAVVSIIDANDRFVFHGARKAVEHDHAFSPSGEVAGAYVQLTMKDKSVSVWTISPEELIEAKNIWKEKYLGNRDYDYLFELIIMLRAIKTLQSTVLFEKNEVLGHLLGNIIAYYNRMFSNFEKERKKRFATSVDQRSRFISNQQSELEKLIDELEDESDIAFGIRINGNEKPKQEDDSAQVVSIGLNGW